MQRAGAIIVTRPEPGLSRTLNRLSDMGLEGIGLPMTELVNLPEPDGLVSVAASATAMIVTSANGAERTLHFAIGKNLPVWCVGRQASGRLAEAGYDVRAIEPDAQHLLDRMLAELPRRASMIYPCGVRRRRLLEDGLREAGHIVHAVELYDNAPVAWTASQIEERLGGRTPGAVLFYAASAASAWTERLSDRSLGGTLRQAQTICLSRDVAAALPPDQRDRARIAASPDEECLLAILTKGV